MTTAVIAHPAHGVPPTRSVGFGGVGGSPRDRDREIVARLVAGDDSALGVIYDQYGALVHGIAVQLVGAEQANDVTQDVFFQLWNKPGAYDPETGSLRTFVAVMARRRAIDELRKAGSRRAREQRVAEEPVAVPNVEEAAVAMITATRLREALTLLPDDQRRAVELAYFQGHTFRDVARATGAAEGTAKSRLRLGLGRLARELAAADNVGAIEWT